MTTWRITLGLVALLAPLSLVGCGDDDEQPTETTAATGDAPADLSSYDTLEDLAAAIVAAGQTCELEYDGLDDATGVVSLCTIGDGQATLRVWNDPADVDEFVESGTATELTVYGENWTIDLRDGEVAADLAAALGGTTG
jgi:YD repeat-containing protein